MEICALDGVHSKKDGKEFILELNDSAIGFNSRYYIQDMHDTRDLVLLRMTQALQSKADRAKNAKEPATAPKKEKTVGELEDELLRAKMALNTEINRNSELEKKLQALQDNKNPGIMSRLFK